MEVFHTPGHTPESACYLLNDRALFTGDTLFLAAVGRPDLEASLCRETEETFVSQILTRLPPTPSNHHRIVALNEADTLPDDPTELEAGANRCAVA